ncbi:MAG: hypothetical protein HC825_04850 [Oscillatoriales cyanobacterium RM1_1_9]|nr:hypothetical protein [Oscillatoriales cyanobacterium RM1_1_9]
MSESYSRSKPNSERHLRHRPDIKPLNSAMPQTKAKVYPLFAESSEAINSKQSLTQLAQAQPERRHHRLKLVSSILVSIVAASGGFAVWQSSRSGQDLGDRLLQEFCHDLAAGNTAKLRDLFILP